MGCQNLCSFGSRRESHPLCWPGSRLNCSHFEMRNYGRKVDPGRITGYPSTTTHPAGSTAGLVSHSLLPYILFRYGHLGYGDRPAWMFETKDGAEGTRVPVITDGRFSTARAQGALRFKARRLQSASKSALPSASS